MKLEAFDQNGEVHQVEAFCSCDEEEMFDYEAFGVTTEQHDQWDKADFKDMIDFCPKCRKFMWYHEDANYALTNAFR
jgi:hypothetical protein